MMITLKAVIAQLRPKVRRMPVLSLVLMLSPVPGEQQLWHSLPVISFQTFHDNSSGAASRPHWPLWPGDLNFLIF